MARVPIIERTIPKTPEEAPSPSGLRRRHPLFVYVFEDTAKAFYIVGCLALDLFLPIQLRLTFAGQEAVVLPVAIAVILGLSYAELCFYRRIWPRKRTPTGVQVFEHGES
jgi:hypothetical protein